MQRRWLVEDQIGRGGMGVVFRARDPATGEHAALKRMARIPGQDRDLLVRFEREARAAQAIQHRNVVRLLDWGEDQGAPCLVFELVEGGSLAERIHREGPLPWREAAAIAASVARGLEAVHAAGLVHRDVKPGNVLLGKDGAKLSDLGLVKRQVGLEKSRALTATGEIVGTPHYAAPEQIRGEPVTPLADLYALGGTLYFALTGVPPFEGSTLAVMTKHIEERPVPPSRLRSGLPRDLERLVLALLEKDPPARGASAGSVARALDAVAVSGSRRTRPLLLAGASLIVAGVAAGAALSGRRAERAPPPSPPRLSPGPPPKAPDDASRLSARLRAFKTLTTEERLGEAPTLLREALARLEEGSLSSDDRKLALELIYYRVHWLVRSGATPEDSDEADTLSAALVRLDAEGAAEALIVRARVLVVRQRWAAMLLIFEELERTGAFDPRMNRNMAVALAGLGRRDEAMARLALVPEADMDGTKRARIEAEIARLADCVVLREQARGLGAVGKHEEALATIERAIATCDTDGDSYGIRGGARHALGDRKGARDDYTRCFELRSPDAPVALCSLGTLRDDQRVAIDDYARAIALDPGCDVAYHNRAAARLLLGIDLDLALDDVNMAERLAVKRNRAPDWVAQLRDMRARLERMLAARKKSTGSGPEPSKK